MSWVDAVILVFLVLAGLHGWRAGATRQVLVFGGLWVGLVIGAFLASVIARIASHSAEGLVAIVLLLLFGLAFATAGEIVGVRLAGPLHRLRFGVLDRVAGVAVSAVATLLAFWLIGNIAANTTLSSLNRALGDSAILRETNRVLPTVPDLFTRIQALLSERGFPLVFANVPQLLPSVPEGSPAEVKDALAAAGPSTVKVFGPACGLTLTGSGFVVAPGLVVTNAHVIAGDSEPEVSDSRGVHHAVPVLFDPHLDVAVLEVPGLSDPSLPVDAVDAPTGATVTVLGYPGGGGLTAVPAGVDGTISAIGFDIYNTTLVTRDVYQLHADVQPGSSGGPVVEMMKSNTAATGQSAEVVGLVFARSLTISGVGYALTMPAVEADVHEAEVSHGAVSTGSCVR